MSSEVPASRPSVNAAISWSFDTFKRNPIPYIALAAVVAVLQFVQQVGLTPVQNALTACTDAQSPGQQAACESARGPSVLIGALVALLFIVLAFLATIGVIRAALGSSRGIPPTFTVLFQTQYLGRYIGFTLLSALLIIVGVVLCIVPGLIVAFLLQLGQFFVLDRGERPWQAVKSSAAVIRRNIGPAVVMMLFVLLVALLGGAFYGILTLITLPFSALFVVHLYRQFNGEPVA